MIRLIAHFMWKNMIWIIQTIFTSFNIENYDCILTFESPSIFKTFPCLYPSLPTIKRTEDISLGFDWLSSRWEILDRNRAFSASPPGNALFFRRELPAQRPKRWFSLKWERKFLTKLEISQKKGLFVCMDLLCCGSLSQPPRASRKEYKLGLG